jgi:hypothetical protein
MMMMMMMVIKNTSGDILAHISIHDDSCLMECDAVARSAVPNVFNDHIIFLLKGDQTMNYPVTQCHSNTCHKSQILINSSGSDIH